MAKIERLRLSDLGKATVMRRSAFGERLRDGGGGVGVWRLPEGGWEDEPEFGALAGGAVGFDAAIDYAGGAAASASPRPVPLVDTRDAGEHVHADRISARASAS